MSDPAPASVTTDLLNADFFTLLGVPKGFAVDQSLLDSRFRELQREVHPDRFAAADDAARRASMMLATQINEGYQTLRSPLKRATYLLSLAGVDVGAESNTAMSPEFLMDQMLWREQLDDARADADPTALSRLQSEIDAQIQQTRSSSSRNCRCADSASLRSTGDNTRFWIRDCPFRRDCAPPHVSGKITPEY